MIAFLKMDGIRRLFIKKIASENQSEKENLDAAFRRAHKDRTEIEGINLDLLGARSARVLSNSNVEQMLELLTVFKEQKDGDSTEQKQMHEAAKIWIVDDFKNAMQRHRIIRNEIKKLVPEIDLTAYDLACKKTQEIFDNYSRLDEAGTQTGSNGDLYETPSFEPVEEGTLVLSRVRLVYNEIDGQITIAANGVERKALRTLVYRKQKELTPPETYLNKAEESRSICNLGLVKVLREFELDKDKAPSKAERKQQRYLLEQLFLKRVQQSARESDFMKNLLKNKGIQSNSYDKTCQETHNILSLYISPKTLVDRQSQT